MSDLTPNQSPASEGAAGPATLLPEAPVAEAAAPPNRKRKILIALIVAVAVLLAALLGALLWYTLTKKPLSQIPVFSQTTPPSYSSAIYDLPQALGIALDESNNRLYVTSGAGERSVTVFTMDGAKIGTLKAPTGAKNGFTPVYVAVDPKNGDVYVSDRSNATIWVYNASGNFVKEFKPEGIKAWQPLGLGFDEQSNLYATDVTPGKARVVEVAPDGSVVSTFGMTENLQFPNGVTALPNGDVAVADSNNGRVLVYAKGKLKGALARGDADSTLGLPRGMALDDTGRLFVVDTSGQNVRVYTPADDASAGLPAYSFIFGEEGSVDGTFEYPNAIATDSEGRLYITDRENGRVQIWSF